MKRLILVSVVIFTAACTNGESSVNEREDRVDFYLDQHEQCLEESTSFTDTLTCQDIFNRQMDAEYRDLDRQLEEILSD